MPVAVQGHRDRRVTHAFLNAFGCAPSAIAERDRRVTEVVPAEVGPSDPIRAFRRALRREAGHGRMCSLRSRSYRLRVAERRCTVVAHHSSTHLPNVTLPSSGATQRLTPASVYLDLLRRYHGRPTIIGNSPKMPAGVDSTRSGVRGS